MQPAKTWTQEVDEGLLHAVIEGQLDRVKYYADKGADLYQQDPEGRRNPLRLAAIRSHFNIVKYLVEEKGVNPGKDTRVLHMTVMAGDHLKDIFTYLVQHGADINGIDPTLGTPLMLSIREGADFRTTKWLVEMNADVTVITPLGTAVHNACEHGNIEILDFLLKHGGDKLFDSVDSRDLTPLTVAADKDRKDIVKFLVNDWKADINEITEVNPLLMSVQKDHIDMVQLLIDLRADVNIVQPRMKCYPLHLAASNNFLDIVKLLCKNGAIVDCLDPRGYTPLFMASSEGYASCVTHLIQSKADVNHRSMDDYTTAIYHAATANRAEVVRILLDHDADPLSTRDENNRTLAEIAKLKGNTSLANLLELWVTIPPDQRHKICAYCNKYVEAAKRCGKCKSVWYCSQDCQRNHWQKHKPICHPT